MFFPGDRFRWFLEARDSAGLTNTFPADTTGFFSGTNYSRVHTVRALPTVTDEGGLPSTPPMLVINDFGHRGGEAEFLSAFGQNGLVEDVDYEVYTVRGPSSLVGNGIGSAGVHGANAQQMQDYSVLFYLSGNLASGVLCDGSNQNGNDKSNDIATLTDWHDLPGDRFAVYFGDNIGSSMVSQGAATQTYLANVMGVNVLSPEVRPAILGQTAPLVVPTGELGAAFVTDFVAYGGCLAINNFDHIAPLSPSKRTHAFTESGPGTPAMDPAASVWYDRDVQIDTETYRRVDLTFPFGLIYVRDYFQKVSTISSRSILVGEILAAFGSTLYPDDATDGPAVAPRRLVVEQNHPNPFNPSTTIRFTAPRAGRYTVRVYNLRGELIQTLFDGDVAAGVPQAVVWNGTDAVGASVSSGVYLYQVQGDRFRETRKMALVK
jgi:hypothetical protein